MEGLKAATGTCEPTVMIYVSSGKNEGAGITFVSLFLESTSLRNGAKLCACFIFVEKL